MINLKGYLLAASFIGVFASAIAALPARTGFDKAVQDYNTHNYSRALSAFQKILGVNPQDAETHYYIALCYQALSQIAAAESEYKWVSSNSQNQSLRNNANQALQNIQAWTAHRTSSGRGNNFQSSSTRPSGNPPLLSLQPKIVTRASEQALGIGSSYAPNSSKEIAGLWERFTPRIPELPSVEGTYSLGISSTTACAGIKLPPGKAFVYVAAMPVKDTEQIPEGMVKIRLNAGRYAVFTHRGPTSDLQRSLDYIWKTWLPKANVKYRDAPSFELYDRQRFNADSAESEIDLYIPIQ